MAAARKFADSKIITQFIQQGISYAQANNRHEIADYLLSIATDHVPIEHISRQSGLLI